MKSKILVDMVNAILLNSKLPSSLWDEVLLTAYHMHRKIAFRKKYMFHFMWKEEKPNLNYGNVGLFPFIGLLILKEQN